jgi:hypothetical protein
VPLVVRLRYLVVCRFHLHRNLPRRFRTKVQHLIHNSTKLRQSCLVIGLVRRLEVEIWRGKQEDDLHFHKTELLPDTIPRSTLKRTIGIFGDNIAWNKSIVLKFVGLREDVGRVTGDKMDYSELERKL